MTIFEAALDRKKKCNWFSPHKWVVIESRPISVVKRLNIKYWDSLDSAMFGLEPAYENRICSKCGKIERNLDEAKEKYAKIRAARKAERERLVELYKLANDKLP